jgi:hypothetical protein
MEEITLKYNSISSLGYVTCNVPSDVMSVIRNEVQEIKENNFITGVPSNRSLVGAIEHEYNMFKSVSLLNKFFSYIVPEYWKLNNKPELATVQFKIDTHSKSSNALWVNYQKKYEFNPLHHHTGALSFIIYIKIPYNIEEEKTQPHIVKQDNPMGPGIIFATPSIDRDLNDSLNITQIPLDSQWENKMILFPSWMDHQAAPFYTSDDYRISVAGNLVSVNNG